MSTATTERVETIQEWAQRIASTLPPFTPEEAAGVGRIAARIDARLATDGQR